MKTNDTLWSLAMVAALAAAVLSPLGSTMIAVALPEMGQDLRVEASILSLWLGMGYLVVSVVGQAPGGRLADHVGHERAILVGLALTGLGTILGTAAGSFGSVAAARICMAAGGAITVPAAMALLRNGTPAARRSRVLGVFAGAMSLAAAIGPWIGGAIVGWLGWKAIFAANVPLIALSVPLLVRQARRSPASLATTRRAPALDVRLFGRRELAAGSLVIGLQNLAMYTLLFQLPLAFSGVTSVEPQETGLALLGMLSGMAVFSPVGGRLAEIVGARLTVVSGSVLTLLGLALLPNIDPGSVPGDASAGLALLGAGLGLSSAPSQSSALGAVSEEEAGFAAGGLATARSLGGIAGIALSNLGGSSAEAPLALGVFAASLTAAAFAALWLPGKQRNPWRLEILNPTLETN